MDFHQVKSSSVNDFLTFGFQPKVPYTKDKWNLELTVGAHQPGKYKSQALGTGYLIIKVR